MMRKALIITILYIILSTQVYTTVYADVFKVDQMKGNWREFSDTYIESERGIGEALLRLYADGYRMGSWILSIDLDLEVEDGGEIYGYIIVEIPELEISLQYTERYVNNGLLGLDYIENNLTLTIGDDTLLNLYDYAYEPMNSRLNVRYYLVLMKVVNTLVFEFRDEYKNPDGLNSVYVYRELDYDDEPVTLILELGKNSYNYQGSIKAPLFINSPKDSVSVESFQYITIDYSSNAIFFLSLSFLLGAISFNIISTKFRILQEEELLREKEKKTKKQRKRKG